MRLRVSILAVLVLLLLLAFTVRVHRLGEKTVWWDEAWSVWTAQQSFPQTTEVTARDVHPPLYQWALHGWVRAAGITEFAIRYLSVLVGLIAAAVVYPLTLRLTASRSAALLALLFIALSAFHIRWSQETRMYAMASCATVLACYAYLRVSERWSGWWLMLIAAGAAVPLTHYLGVFVLIILNLHWLITLRSRSRQFNMRWIGAMVVTALIVGAWLAFAISRIRSGGTDSEVQPAFIFQLAAALLAVGTSVNIEQYNLPALIVVLGLLLGLALYTRQNWRNGVLVLLFVLVPPLAIFLLSMPNPFYHPHPEERYLIIFIPVVYVGVGIALNRLWRVSRLVGIVAATGLLVLYANAVLRDMDARYYRDDYATMLRTVNLLANPDEPILFVSGDRYPLVYYHLNRAANGYSGLDVREIPRIDDTTDIDSLIRAIIGTRDRFWLVEIEKNLGDPGNRVIPYLDANYKRILRIPIDYNALAYYSKDDVPIPSSDQILLSPQTEYRPGDVLRFGLPPNTSATLTPVLGLRYDWTPLPNWQLQQHTVYGAFESGVYELGVGENIYPINVAHTQIPATTETYLLGRFKALDVQFGSMRLRGYSINPIPWHRGQTLDITLDWLVEEEMTENYTVFVHLLGEFNPATSGPLWAGHDSYPANTPTSVLYKGQSFTDWHQLIIPPDAPTGEYILEIGLYKVETGERLKRTDNGEDHVLISGFTVER